MKTTTLILTGVAAAATIAWSAHEEVVHASPGDSGRIDHVLLLSIDGMHAVDFLNCAHGIGATEDDVSVLWLSPGKSVDNAVAILETNKSQIGLGQLYNGPSLALNYNRGGLGPGLDPRSPDIVVTPNVGMTYSGSTTMQVAPTILKALGLDPKALDAVRAEGTQVLPEVVSQLPQY